jgi:sarcosine oxidase subunit gamma
MEGDSVAERNDMGTVLNRTPIVSKGFNQSGVTLTPELQLCMGKVQFLRDTTAGFGGTIFGRSPPPARHSVLSQDVTISWLAPDEWLLTGPESGVFAMLGRAAEAGDACLATDLTHARAAFQLSGEKARERLAALTPFDLGEASMPVGGVARAPLGDTGMFLARLADIGGQPAFRIIVDQTMAAYAVRMLSGPATQSGAIL